MRRGRSLRPRRQSDRRRQRNSRRNTPRRRSHRSRRCASACGTGHRDDDRRIRAFGVIGGLLGCRLSTSVLGADAKSSARVGLVGVQSAREEENGASELSDLIVKDGPTSAPSVIPTLFFVFFPFSHLVPTRFSDNDGASHY